MSRTRLRQACPIFPVNDLRSALDHYALLGFTVRPYAARLWLIGNAEAVSLHEAIKFGKGVRA